MRRVRWTTLPAIGVAFLSAALGSPGVAVAAEGSPIIPPSLYREGQPAVLAPQPKEPATIAPDENAVIGDFGRAYSRLNQPRIAVYWNRSLTDLISQWFEPSRISATGEFELNLVGPRGPMRGTGRGSESVGKQYLRTDEPRRGMEERVSMEFENGFYGPFLSIGTRLVDRAAILRLARNDMPHRLQRDASPDVQALEMEALKDYADLLLEILLVPDRTVPTGYAFHVLVKRILTGQIMVSHFSRAAMDTEGKPAKGELVPGPGGFYRKPAEPDKMDPAALGHRLALETMQAVSRLPER